MSVSLQNHTPSTIHITIGAGGWPMIILLLPLQLIHTTVVNINIITLGFMSTDLRASLVYTGPIMELGIEKMNAVYKDTLNLSLTYIGGKAFQTCQNLGDNNDYLVSKWYYTERDERIPAVFLTAGCEPKLLDRLTTEWNILFLTSVSVKDAQEGPTRSPTRIFASTTSGSRFAQLYREIMLQFNWTSVFVVTDRSSAEFYAIAGEIFIASVKSLTQKQWQIITRQIFAKHGVVDYKGLLREFSFNSRVLFFYGHAGVLREFMITAARLGMTNGEYVYLAMETAPVKAIFGTMTWKYGDANDAIAASAYRSLLVIQPNRSTPATPMFEHIVQNVLQRTLRDYNYTYPDDGDPVNLVVTPYAAVQALAQIINTTVSIYPTFDFSNGAAFALLFLNRAFASDVHVEKIFYDDSGQIRADMMVSSFKGSAAPVLTPVLGLWAQSAQLVKLAEMDWPNDVWPPPNEPFCGFRGQKSICRQESVRLMYVIALSSLGSILAVTITAAGICFRRYQKTAAVRDHWWQISYHQLVPISVSRSVSNQSRQISEKSEQKKHPFVPRHVYNGKNVHVRVFSCTSNPLAMAEACFNWSSKVSQTAPGVFNISTSNKLLSLFKQLRKLSHANINHFIGITVIICEENRFLLGFVSDFASRGSITDIIDSPLQFDWNVSNSLIFDLLEGLEYIHDSELQCHGHVTSANCVVDKYFTLKLAELGFSRIEQGITNQSAQISDFQNGSRVCTEPDVLNGTKVADAKSDIFSAAVVILHIITKQAPQLEHPETFQYDELVKRLSISLKRHLDFAQSSVPESVAVILTKCWTIEPSWRLTAKNLKIQLRHNLSSWADIDQNMKIVDKIISRLANYSDELEIKIRLRTRELISERAKCDTLLKEILPATIVKNLREGQSVHPETFEEISLLFGDLCGFAEFIAINTPLEVIERIMEIEATFDKELPKFSVYKVEAVNDTYMARERQTTRYSAASGIPIRNGSEHFGFICSFALGMQACFLRAKFMGTARLQLRIGIHSGPCVAGIMGLRRPRYCLFGDTVNTASRICSHGEPSKIHLSLATADGVKANRQFHVVSRGVIPIKSKKDMHTYWLEH